MFELTNEQRACFGLEAVQPHWTRLVLKPRRYQQTTTIAYLEGCTVKKYVESGDHLYRECGVYEQVSEDYRYLLPKTAKGKPVLLSTATLEKRIRGMYLMYHSDPGRPHIPAHISLFNIDSQREYYCSMSEALLLPNIDAFRQWVEQWYAESTPDDLVDVARFAAQPRIHVNFQEGDVFRFKLDRRLYGYGRILLNYDLMRKRKEPFWDSLMGKPLVCSAYRIATERKDVTTAELEQLGSLPSEYMMDNHLFYGGYEIIGHIPVTEQEDYPIRYGYSTNARCKDLLLQCGRVHRKIENGTALYEHYQNCGIGYQMHIRLPVLRQCIQAQSNDPHWAQDNAWANYDLRNPKLRPQLEEICRQFDLSPEQLLK